MRRPGVRLRVAGAFALAMAVLLTVAGFAIRAGLRDEITGATDETLETRATAVARLLVDRGRPLPGLTDGLDDPGRRSRRSSARAARSSSPPPGCPVGRSSTRPGATRPPRG